LQQKFQLKKRFWRRGCTMSWIAVVHCSDHWVYRSKRELTLVCTIIEKKGFGKGTGFSRAVNALTYSALAPEDLSG
jgi:hypothetical protein